MGAEMIILRAILGAIVKETAKSVVKATENSIKEASRNIEKNTQLNKKITENSGVTNDSLWTSLVNLEKRLSEYERHLGETSGMPEDPRVAKAAFESLMKPLDRAPIVADDYIKAMVKLSPTLIKHGESIEEWGEIVIDLTSITNSSAEKVVDNLISLISGTPKKAKTFNEAGITQMLGFDPNSTYSTPNAFKAIKENAARPSISDASDRHLQGLDGTEKARKNMWFKAAHNFMDSGVYDYKVAYEKVINKSLEWIDPEKAAKSFGEGVTSALDATVETIVTVSQQAEHIASNIEEFWNTPLHSPDDNFRKGWDTENFHSKEPENKRSFTVLRGYGTRARFNPAHDPINLKARNNEQQEETKSAVAQKKFWIHPDLAPYVKVNGQQPIPAIKNPPQSAPATTLSQQPHTNTSVPTEALSKATSLTVNKLNDATDTMVGAAAANKLTEAATTINAPAAATIIASAAAKIVTSADNATPDKQSGNATKNATPVSQRPGASTDGTYADAFNTARSNPAEAWMTRENALFDLDGEKAEEFKKSFDMGATAGVLKGQLDGMAGAFTSFFITVQETGKFAYKELAASLVKQIQVQAAGMLTRFMLEAAYHGIMAIVEPGKIDPLTGATHASSAIAALKGMAVMGAFVTGSTLAGMAHDGMDSIPEEGTWLLNKGERVVDSRTNEDLKGYLKNGGNGGAQVNITINEPRDKDSVLSAIPELRRMIVDTVGGNIASNGSLNKTIRAYT